MPDIHNGWDWEDTDGERSIPHVTPVRDGDNELDPTPPRGWLKVYSYCSALPVASPEAGAWMYLIGGVQDWEEKKGRQRQAHMICRDLYGQRVLVVHPDLEKVVAMDVECLNSLLTDCPCGGHCIEPYLSTQAARVFARRTCELILPSRIPRILDRLDLHRDVLRWKEISLPRRLELIDEERLNPEALGDDLHWLDILQLGSADLDHLAREMHEAAGEDSLVDPAFEI